MGIIFFSILAGIFVGILLEKGKILEPEIVIKQFLLQDFTLLKTVLIAVAMSSVVFSFLAYFDLMFIDSFSFNLPHVLIGGTLIGIGVSLTGALPISIMGQLGVGYLESLFIIIGFILGAMFYNIVLPILGYLSFMPKLTVATVNFELGYPYWLVAPIFAALLVFIVVCIYFIEKRIIAEDFFKSD